MAGDDHLTHARMVDLLRTMGRSEGHADLWAAALEKLVSEVTDGELPSLYTAIWQFRQLLTLTLRRLAEQVPAFPVDPAPKVEGDMEVGQ